MAKRAKGYQVRARLLSMAKDQPGENGEAIRIALADLDAAAAIVAAARVVTGALSDEQDMDRLRAALRNLDSRKEPTNA